MREGQGIIFLEDTDSTNLYAERELESLQDHSVIAAYNQTEGHGQYDHSWHSNPGENILMTIVLKPETQLPASEMAMLLSPALTLGILDYLSEKGIQARIKWPNDIWVGDRKICGILIKTFIQQTRLNAAILGVGLNLNETDFPSCLPNPVSVCNLTGKQYDVRDETVKLYKKICRRFDLVGQEEGRLSLQEEFGENVFRLP